MNCPDCGSAMTQDYPKVYNCKNCKKFWGIENMTNFVNNWETK